VSITLIENFRAVFYTPFYAPIALGAYEAEGIEVRIRASPEAARTIDTLVAGEGEVSWGGLSRLMGGLSRNPARAPVAFCEVIGRDPFFLIGREPKPDFRFHDLLKRRIAIVSEVPAPWMCLHYDLALAGIDPAQLQCISGRTMAENTEALRSGEVDVIQVFHPYAHELTAAGAGHVWYAAATRGPATYTTLNTTRDFANREPEVLRAMCRAMYSTQEWIARHDGHELARAVASFFPAIAPSTLAACFDDYKALGVWNETPLLSPAGFEWIRDAGLSNGRVPRRFSYDECVDMRFAEEAVTGVDRVMQPYR
jgi:NitT/TauT family transport system substrate-binding protein